MADRTMQIPSIEDTMLQGAENVIDQSIIAMNHPSGSVVSNMLYANPRNSKLDLAKMQIRVGVYKVPPTSLGIGSSISFTILNRSIIMGLYLSGSITLPAYSGLPSSWFYYLINTLQFQISGINNLQYSGITLRDMYLLEASEDRRNYLNTDLCPALDNTGNPASQKFDFIVPIALPFNQGNTSIQGFAMDANTLSSTMQLNFNFNPLSHVVMGVTGSPSFPTSFDSLYLKTYLQLDHIEQNFAAHRISNIFKVPFNFPQYYILPNQACGPTGAINGIQLQQLPQGELIRIVLSAYPSSGVGNGNSVVNYDPVKFSYLRLTLNGNDLLLLESEKEIYNQQMFNSNGDDAGFKYISQIYTSNTLGNTGPSGSTGLNFVSRTRELTCLDTFVPAASASFFLSEFAVAESFNGQVFQLQYRLAPPYDGITSLNWNITYISNAILHIENGEAKLQT